MRRVAPVLLDNRLAKSSRQGLASGKGCRDSDGPHALSLFPLRVLYSDHPGTPMVPRDDKAVD
jgi:hypothetical protein